MTSTATAPELRSWLERQISSEQYKGLRWVRYDNEAKVFILPLVSKYANIPQKEAYYKLFRDWEASQELGQKDADVYLLRAIFMSILSKSVDFEDVTRDYAIPKEYKYKVFRFVPLSGLSTEESLEKLTLSSVDTQLEQNDGKASNQEEDVPIHVYPMAVNGNNGQFRYIQTATNASLACGDEIFLTVTADPPPIEIGQSGQEREDSSGIGDMHSHSDPNSSTESHNEGLGGVQPALQQSSREASDASSVTAGISDLRADDATAVLRRSDFEKSLDEVMVDTTERQLDKMGVTKEMLGSWKLTVKYNSQTVLESRIALSQLCYRVCCGDQEVVTHLMKKNTALDGYWDSEIFKIIELPPLDSYTYPVSDILSLFSMGIAIWYSPEALAVYAIRLCQSHVYYYDPHDLRTGPDLKKLARSERTQVFSYITYLQRYQTKCQVPLGHTCAEDGGITFVVGTKPRSKAAVPNMKGLTIELTPRCVEILRAMAEDFKLCYSRPSSCDVELKGREEQIDTCTDVSSV